MEKNMSVFVGSKFYNCFNSKYPFSVECRQKNAVFQEGQCKENSAIDARTTNGQVLSPHFILGFFSRGFMLCFINNGKSQI